MLLRLGFETYVHHATADGDRLELMDVRSKPEYRAMLASILGFESAFEAALAPLVGTQLRERARAHYLRRDLHALGMTTSAIDCLPQCTIRLTSLTQALGWMFVVERHTMLAGLIQRHLIHRYGDQFRDATTYLARCSDSPGARFRSLCATIDNHAAQHDAYPTMLVTAAIEAFRCQRQWYSSAPSELDLHRDTARLLAATT
jgi:heme oxygenase